MCEYFNCRLAYWKAMVWKKNMNFSVLFTHSTSLIRCNASLLSLYLLFDILQITTTWIIAGLAHFSSLIHLHHQAHKSAANIIPHNHLYILTICFSIQHSTCSPHTHAYRRGCSFFTSHIYAHHSLSKWAKRRHLINIHKRALVHKRRAREALYARRYCSIL